MMHIAFIVGLLIGCYAGAAVTFIIMDGRREQEEGGGGDWVPDFVPDDLLPGELHR